MIRKQLILGVIATSTFFVGSLATATAANALTFGFSGSDQGGTGSATMEFVGLDDGDNAIQILLDNTSPTTLDNTSGVNAPGITFFGFDGLSGSAPAITSWTLSALDDSGTSITIDGTGKNFWSLDTFRAGVSLDYLFENDGNVKGALYNPDATAGLAAKPNYFTTATLDIVFADVFKLDKDSTFVRMQNVGLNGAGSLKLDGIIVSNPTPVPTPIAVLPIIGSMIGAASRRRKSASERSESDA